jgi:4-hydroxybenzoyl-CoA thioesterase
MDQGSISRFSSGANGGAHWLIGGTEIDPEKEHLKESNMAFETTTEVRFAHVDAAAIVFYPRYFEMLNAAVEDWCAQALGLDFLTMHNRLGIGVPTVKMDAEFVRPSILGDRLTIRLQALKVGRTSCEFSYEFSGDDGLRLKGSAVLVCMNLQEQRSQPWPDVMRENLMADLAHAA